LEVTQGLLVTETGVGSLDFLYTGRLCIIVFFLFITLR